MRLAASRTFCTAGSSNPIRTAMMAITTRSSMSVKPRGRCRGVQPERATARVPPKRGWKGVRSAAGASDRPTPTGYGRESPAETAGYSNGPPRRLSWQVGQFRNCLSGNQVGLEIGGDRWLLPRPAPPGNVLAVLHRDELGPLGAVAHDQAPLAPGEREPTRLGLPGAVQQDDRAGFDVERPVRTQVEEDLLRPGAETVAVLFDVVLARQRTLAAPDQRQQEGEER